MIAITDHGKAALKLLFTDFLTRYNSYNIKDKLGLSNAGSLKLLRRLHEKNLLISEELGNAIFYKPNIDNPYLIKLLELTFLDHSTLSSFVKGWIYDLGSFAPLTKALLLFGSILTKGKEARDIDVCFILNRYSDYNLLQSRIQEMNKKNNLKIHPLLITTRDFEERLKQKDKPLLDIVKTCVVVHGQELFVRVLKNVQGK